MITFNLILSISSFQSNKEKSTALKDEAEAKRRAEKKERVQKMAEGKRPYYMKKCKFYHCLSLVNPVIIIIFDFTATKKYLDLAEKYDELKAKGKIETYLKKKRAKNASRDKKLLKL